MQQTTLRPPVEAHDASRLDRMIASVGRSSVQLVRGRQAIINMEPVLATLARNSALTGEADNLAYFLSTPYSLKKIPWLLTIGDPARRSKLIGAVLLFEYRIGLWGTRVFAGADRTGRRDLIAAPEMRAQVAAIAARTLLQQGAHIVYLTFSDAYRDDDCPGVPAGVAEQAISAELHAIRHRAQWSLEEREIPSHLPMLPTFDETLARIGQRTRSNLRYYRRRAETDLGARFVTDVEITVEQFLAFNRECKYAVPDAEARLRYRTAHTHPNFSMRGVVDGAGRWLSLVGVRRHNGFIEIHWQMNREDLPHCSLATVLRSMMIDDEIAHGFTRLYIEGGTPQPIGRSFVPLRIDELLVKRNSFYVRLLERFASVVFPPKNYVGQLLKRTDLCWRRG